MKVVTKMDKSFTSNNKSENLKYSGTAPNEIPFYITSPPLLLPHSIGANVSERKLPFYGPKMDTMTRYHCASQPSKTRLLHLIAVPPRLRTNGILQGCVVKIEDFFRSKVKIHGIL